MRTCVVCRTREAPDELIRWRIGEDDVLSQTLAIGRGYWTHTPTTSCANPTRLISALERRGIRVARVVGILVNDRVQLESVEIQPS